MEKITLERYRKGNYTINFEGKAYIVPGMKGSIVGRKEIPYSVYEYLSMFTTCFKDGDLVIKTKSEEEKEELLENMHNVEDYLKNALTKEEVVKMLGYAQKKMETELNKIENNATKDFVLEVAKEIELSSAAKQRFIKEWLGMTLPIEDIFKF